MRYFPLMLYASAENRDWGVGCIVPRSPSLPYPPDHSLEITILARKESKGPHSPTEHLFWFVRCAQSQIDPSLQFSVLSMWAFCYSQTEKPKNRSGKERHGRYFWDMPTYFFSLQLYWKLPSIDEISGWFPSFRAPCMTKSCIVIKERELQQAEHVA
jgi:hypothetical protein